MKILTFSTRRQNSLNGVLTRGRSSRAHARCCKFTSGSRPSSSRRPILRFLVSDDGQETYHLFTLDTHSVRSVSVQKGKKFFAAINLSAAKNVFAWKTLQLDTASTTNTLAVDYLQTMCPAGFDIYRLIKPSSAILRTYGGGVIKPVGQVELVCETQESFTLFSFSC